MGNDCCCPLDRHVRKAAVQLLSIAAHNKADLVREQLPGLLPRLYQQTVTDEALIRTVDLGPFKHKIDDGLELRKAAFECMDVLLDKASDRLYLPDFIRHLQSGIEAGASSMPCLPVQLTVLGLATMQCVSRRTSRGKREQANASKLGSRR